MKGISKYKYILVKNVFVFMYMFTFKHVFASLCPAICTCVQNPPKYINIERLDYILLFVYMLGGQEEELQE